MIRHLHPLRLILGLALALAGQSARAMIVIGDGGNAGHNTVPPTGALADSGWQYQAFFDFTGTVVGPEHILTARHLGIGANALVRFDGLIYRTLAVTNLPQSDLSLLRVAGRFARWAPLYRKPDEVGKVVTLFGRGLARGGPIFHETDGTNALRGWFWGAADGRPRWGTNVIEEAFAPGVADEGAILTAVFNANAGDDEATLAGGDSGGGLFLHDTDGQWKLAGVALAVQAQFNTETTSSGFFAALFDRRGFYERDPQQQWSLDPAAESQPGTALYHTRVSTYATQLAAAMAVPAPGTASVPRLQSSASPDGPFEEHGAYAVDSAAREITANVTGESGFFRLEGTATVRVLTATGTQVRFGF